MSFVHLNVFCSIVYPRHLPSVIRKLKGLLGYAVSLGIQSFCLFPLSWSTDPHWASFAYLANSHMMERGLKNCCLWPYWSMLIPLSLIFQASPWCSRHHFVSLVSLVLSPLVNAINCRVLPEIEQTHLEPASVLSQSGMVASDGRVAAFPKPASNTDMFCF